MDKLDDIDENGENWIRWAILSELVFLSLVK